MENRKYLVDNNFEKGVRELGGGFRQCMDLTLAPVPLNSSFSVALKCISAARV